MNVNKNISEIERLLRKSETVILNSGFEVTSIGHWQRAMDLVTNDEAQIFLGRTDGTLVRSKYLSFPRPLVVSMFKYVPAFKPRIGDDCLVSKWTVLSRDNYICQYCFGKSGKPGDTVDHIHPESQGGLRTWGNLVACCKPCNQKKADKSLSEIGYKKPVIPAMTHINMKIIRVQNSIQQYLKHDYMIDLKEEQSLVIS